MLKENRKKRTNNTIKLKQRRKEYIIGAIAILLLIISFVYTYTPFNIGFFNISLSLQEQHDLLFNLFTVQATIAALSISIIAIITGFQTESVYGITVTNYITTLKPCLFKHKTLMIADLIITVLNYVFVSFGLYNVSVMIFVISVIISCVLIIDTAFVFKSHSEISNEIGQYIKENINLDYLGELEKSANEFATLENTAGVEETLSFINEIFNFEIKKANYSNEILEKIEKILTDLFINRYLSRNKDMVFGILKSIKSLYDTAKDEYELDIWSYIYSEYLTFISTVSMPQLINYKKFDYRKFKWSIENNQKFENKSEKIQEKNNFYLEYYYLWMYVYVVKKSNRDFEKDDIEYFKESLFDDAYTDALYSSQSNKELKQKRITGLCYLIKTLIENGEIELLKSKYLRHEEYRLKDIDNAFIYVINIIYSFYLAYLEPMVHGTDEQNSANEFLEAIRKQDIHTILYHIKLAEMLEAHVLDIFNLMRNWEKYENGVMKTVILEPSIRNFLFFICIEKYYDEKSLAKCFKLITSSHVESLIMNYFGRDNLFVDQYKSFHKKLFNSELQKHKLESAQVIVRGALEREYKEELLNEVKEKCIKDAVLEEYREKLYKFFDSELSDYSIFNNKLDNIQTKPISVKINHFIDVNELAQKELSNWISESITNYLYRLFVSSFLENIKTEKVNNQNKHKQELLIDSSKEFEPDTYLGSRETFWDEAETDLLIKFTENMHRISDQYCANQMFLINSSLIHYSVTNIKFTFEDCTIDDFAPLGINVQNETYYYSKYSTELKAPFTKEELFDYLHKTLKRLIITADVNYATKCDVIGSGIEVSYEELDDILDEENNTPEKEEQPSD